MGGLWPRAASRWPGSGTSPQAPETEPLVRPLPDRPFDLPGELLHGVSNVGVTVLGVRDDNRWTYRGADPEPAVAEAEDGQKR